MDFFVLTEQVLHNRQKENCKTYPSAKGREAYLWGSLEQRRRRTPCSWRRGTAGRGGRASGAENVRKWGKRSKVQVVADLERELGFDILVEEAEGEDGERGVEKIVHSYEILPQGSLQARVDWKRKVTWHIGLVNIKLSVLIQSA